MNKTLTTVLSSIAGMIVLAQVAPVFYDAVGLKPGMLRDTSACQQERGCGYSVFAGQGD